jgi:hypothetical protein
MRSKARRSSLVAATAETDVYDDAGALAAEGVETRATRRDLSREGTSGEEVEIRRATGRSFVRSLLFGVPLPVAEATEAVKPSEVSRISACDALLKDALRGNRLAIIGGTP